MLCFMLVGGINYTNHVKLNKKQVTYGQKSCRTATPLFDIVLKKLTNCVAEKIMNAGVLIFQRQNSDYV